MDHQSDRSSIGILGRPLVDAVAAFAIGAAFGFIVSESEILESRRNVFLYAGAVEVDHNRDGEIDAWYVYRGEDLTRARADRNFDGQPDEWSFFRSGDLVRTEQDDDFDGEVDVRSSYRYGVLTEVSIDTDYNGVPDYTGEYEDGVIRVGRWHPNGGRVEREERFREGVLREVVDVHLDGPPTLLHTYDSFGRIQSAD